jgi:DNA-binding LytR/AlgR family response regulator
MTKKVDKLIQKLRDEFGLILSISFGIFLFILYFNPFPINNLDLNNSLVYLAGFGGIVFLTVALIHSILPLLIGEHGPDENNRKLFPEYMNGFLIFLISAVAFEFYLRYVGSVKINFTISFKVFFICLVPPVILRLYDRINGLILQNESLILEKKIIQKQVEKYEEDYLNKSVEFISENTNENFSLLIAEIVFIRSADNYVEIVYKEGETFKKKLIRNTLKNIEQQIRQYSNFFRCHRICIVNLHFVEKLDRNNESHWLIIKGFSEQLPVSRQYLLKLKEAL